MLLATSIFTTVVTALAAVAVVVWRPRYWRSWAAYLAVMASLNVVLTWSYFQMLFGVRSVETHFVLVTYIGPALRANSGLLLLAGLVGTYADVREVRAKLDAK